MKAALPRLSLDLEPELSSALKELAAAVARFGEANGLSDSQVHNLSLALDELATNTISYGFTDVDRQELQVELRIEDDEIIAQLHDTGVPFNPFEEVAVPDVHASIDDRSVGGLGVFLTRTLFPNADYERTDGSNRITLRAPVKGDS